MDNQDLAWKLIATSPWGLNTSEKMALICLARALDQRDEPAVSPVHVAQVWGCSKTNAREFLTRPRIAEVIRTRRATGQDGIERTYFSLGDGWGENPQMGEL